MATGRLGRAQLDALDRHLADLSTEDAFRVLLVHHPLHSNSRMKQLTDSKALRAVLKRRGVELVLHGHDHIHSTMWIEGADRQIPAIGVPSASALAHRHYPAAAYNLFSIARDGDKWRCVQTVRGFGDRFRRQASCNKSDCPEALIPAAATSTAAVASTTAVAAAVTTMAASVAAGVTKPGRAAVDRAIGEIAAAIRRTAAVLAQLFAIGVIDEAVGNIELAVERKQQRQPVGLTGSIFSYLQQYHQTRRRPSLLLRCSLRTTAGAWWRKPPNARRQKASYSRVYRMNSCHRSSATCEGIET